MLIIFNVWMKKQIQPLQRLISNMLFEISYINKQGEIDTLRRTICGEEFESMIHVMRFRSKKTFIYDATNKEQTCIDHQHFSFTQNSIYSEGSNMIATHNMVSNQYGRLTNIDVPLININDNFNERSFENDQYFSI